MKVCCWCVPLLLLVSTGLGAAEASAPSSMLTVEVGRDSVDSEEAYVDLDLGFDNGLHLLGMLGQSRQQSDNELQETTSRLIGISSEYSAPIVAGLDYEYWGDEGVLETRTNRFKLGTNTDNWYVQLTYEDRRTRLYGKAAKLPVVELDSTGKGIHLSYYGLYPWSLSVSYMKYDYDRDTTVLKKYPGWAHKRFSTATLGMATGLESWRRTGELSYSFDWGVIGVSGAQSESAVDQSLASNVAVYVIWDMSYNWSMTLTGGQYATDNSSDTTRYGRAAVSYRW